MKKKHKDKEEILHTSIGKLRKIPKEELKFEFNWTTIGRPLIIWFIFFVILFFYFDYIGLVVSILLTLIYEISAYKQNAGLLEVVETGELLPFYSGVWEKVNYALAKSIPIIAFIDIIIIFIWLGSI
jgi:hypothetical protein